MPVNPNIYNVWAPSTAQGRGNAMQEAFVPAMILPGAFRKVGGV